jgi:succinate dehydrogenase flavin-adding protein (antitoxin of CptAB toxin-antitoxin module)
MDFVSEIKRVGVAEAVRVLGCPERTAYSWVMGERLPPEWVQKLVISRLRKIRPTRRQSQRP